MQNHHTIEYDPSRPGYSVVPTASTTTTQAPLQPLDPNYILSLPGYTSNASNQQQPPQPQPLRRSKRRHQDGLDEDSDNLPQQQQPYQNGSGGGRRRPSKKPYVDLPTLSDDVQQLKTQMAGALIALGERKEAEIFIISKIESLSSSNQNLLLPPSPSPLLPPSPPPIDTSMFAKKDDVENISAQIKGSINELYTAVNDVRGLVNSTKQRLDGSSSLLLSSSKKQDDDDELGDIGDDPSISKAPIFSGLLTSPAQQRQQPSLVESGRIEVLEDRLNEETKAKKDFQTRYEQAQQQLADQVDQNKQTNEKLHQDNLQLTEAHTNLLNKLQYQEQTMKEQSEINETAIKTGNDAIVTITKQLLNEKKVHQDDIASADQIKKQLLVDYTKSIQSQKDSFQVDIIAKENELKVITEAHQKSQSDIQQYQSNQQALSHQIKWSIDQSLLFNYYVSTHIQFGQSKHFLASDESNKEIYRRIIALVPDITSPKRPSVICINIEEFLFNLSFISYVHGLKSLNVPNYISNAAGLLDPMTTTFIKNLGKKAASTNTAPIPIYIYSKFYLRGDNVLFGSEASALGHDAMKGFLSNVCKLAFEPTLPLYFIVQLETSDRGCSTTLSHLAKNNCLARLDQGKCCKFNGGGQAFGNIHSVLESIYRKTPTLPQNSIMFFDTQKTAQSMLALQSKSRFFYLDSKYALVEAGITSSSSTAVATTTATAKSNTTTATTAASSKLITSIASKKK